MKILHVMPSYEPAWAFGGTVTATSNLCRGLARKGADVTVYTTDADGKGGFLNVPLNEPVDLGGVNVWYFHCDLFPEKAFYSRGLAKKLKEVINKFDIVHISAIWQWIQVDVYRKCIDKNIPYIVTPHSSLMKYAFYSVGHQLQKKLYWNLIGEKTIRKANAIQFLCEGEREESELICNATQSFIVPNGIYMDKFKKDAIKRSLLREKYSMQDDTMVLLFLGRIHPKKQIELIIKSFPHVSQYRKNIAFLVAGPVEDNIYFSKLKKLSRELSVDSQIIWAGPVNNQEVLDYYSASDIMVLPSIVEGISMALTEAMCASLPLLISNRVANWHEVLEDKAGLVAEPDYQSVRDALIQICSSPELLQQLSGNARKSAENRYDINKVASLMLKAYEDVLAEKRSPELQWK